MRFNGYNAQLAPERLLRPRRRAQRLPRALPAAITPALEPLMTRAVGAYYVVGDAPIRALRRQQLAFGEIAAAGNVAARSGRSLGEIAGAYQQHRNWARVAREAGVPPSEVYMALNSPRAVAAGDALEEGGPIAERTPERGEPPALPQPGRPANPIERVAGARMEFVGRQPAVLLRHVVATYYGLPDATLRWLEAWGWTLPEYLIAGNVSVRSELSFEEVVALRHSGLDWQAVARRAGIRQADILQPTISRRLTSMTR